MRYFFLSVYICIGLYDKWYLGSKTTDIYYVYSSYFMSFASVPPDCEKREAKKKKKITMKIWLTGNRTSDPSLSNIAPKINRSRWQLTSYGLNSYIILAYNG